MARTKAAKKESKKDSAASESSHAEAAERRTSAKPDKPGEKDGDVQNGYRWDKAANDWMDHRGIDFTSDPSQLQHNFEHVGDGSPEKPHQVRQVGRWS